MPIWILYLYFHNHHFSDYGIVNCYITRYAPILFIIYDIVIIQKTFALMKRKNV